MSNAVELLMTGIEQSLPEGGLEKKLAHGRPLRIKLGADPTAPDIHLGHVVILSKLRQFQDAGHIIQFIIGDFTARIGDPTGRSKARPPLGDEEIAQNAKTYLEQVTRVLDKDKLEVYTNSSWLGKLNLDDFVRVAGKVTLARVLERDDFTKRYQSGTAIGFHELFYPLLQASDSVELKSDVELGGTDQTFNLLMGRYLQEQYGQEPQVVMTLPLLEGLDGVQKMSKSYGNYIGLTEPADKVFGKIMSISDDLMWRYWTLLSGKSQADVDALRGQVTRSELHPLACKKQLAHTILTRFWSAAAADEGQKQFAAVFQQKDYSQATPVSLPAETENPLWIVDLLRLLGAVSSSSEARRLIAGGAVSVDQNKVTDFKAQIAWAKGITIRVGKHRIYCIE